jgi:hypothetical protein
MISPELQAKISLWRIKAATGELTLEEAKEAVAHLRAGRLTAAASAASTKRKAAIKAIPHADDLLDELGGV